MKFSTEYRTIDKAIESLNSKIATLEDRLEKRENYFNEKSDKWQESNAGDLYYEETERLDDEIGQIREVVENLQASIEVLEEL